MALRAKTSTGPTPEPPEPEDAELEDPEPEDAEPVGGRPCQNHNSNVKNTQQVRFSDQ